MHRRPLPSSSTGSSMTDRSRPPLRPPLRTQDLSPKQRTLVDLMSEHQFGRIENIAVRAGEPILGRSVKVVRVIRLGGESGGTRVPLTNEFELKQAVRDLLDELVSLDDGVVLRLEFKRGLPCLLETVQFLGSSEPQAPMGPQTGPQTTRHS